MPQWFEIEDVDRVISPALLFYPERIQTNLQQMIGIAGSADRLRPHVKTHKCAELVNMQLEAGISRFKCATLQEAAMLGEAGAPDVHLAYPLVGPAVQRFADLTRQYPHTQFSFILDHQATLPLWEKVETYPDVFIDLDVGTQRTGCEVSQAENLLEQVKNSPHTFRGWHIYDGHIHATDLDQRKKEMEAVFGPVVDLMEKTGTQSYEWVCGSSITFPLHAAYPDRRLSPGTTILWDHGYSSQFPDLPFDIAATVLTRVVSKPSANTLTVDLGYKAVASEMAAIPVYFPQLPGATLHMHSEEHMVLSTNQAGDYQIGDVLYALP
ncbi:MAG TPA: threonine aldolase, partial [Cytophagales bacterium]|nr:threonine aldolase [Cytophagales bacterium]